MHSVAIRDLKNNPANMTKFLEKGESVFITKHGKPLGITLPLSDEMLKMGMLKAVALEQYRQGLISLGKMAELMGIGKPEAMKLLSELNIDWMEYTAEEIDEELQTLSFHEGTSKNPVRSQRNRESHNQGDASKAWPKPSREAVT